MATLRTVLLRERQAEANVGRYVVGVMEAGTQAYILTVGVRGRLCHSIKVFSSLRALEAHLASHSLVHLPAEYDGWQTCWPTSPRVGTEDPPARSQWG
jgi:hypothetical protein